jgi:hypothetical protein
MIGQMAFKKRLIFEIQKKMFRNPALGVLVKIFKLPNANYSRPKVP